MTRDVVIVPSELGLDAAKVTVASAMTPLRATCTPDTPLFPSTTDLMNSMFEPETIPSITFVEADWDDDWDDDWLTDGGAGS